jgi:hypothetical protein
VEGGRAVEVERGGEKAEEAREADGDEEVDAAEEEEEVDEEGGPVSDESAELMMPDLSLTRTRPTEPDAARLSYFYSHTQHHHTRSTRAREWG